MSIDNPLEVNSFVTANLHTITNALFNHAERMDVAAKEAQAEYERGAADQEVRRAQDATMITNRGYQGMASTFAQEAAQARKVANELTRLVEDRDDDEDES